MPWRVLLLQKGYLTDDFLPDITLASSDPDDKPDRKERPGK
eukprot:CAMPEP_0202366626 /NCGR_PEP_ID=MMETSP1126-20121109/17159_1 /ASSEMBLY_ACC=CAM_ASM_000457 /TAXON_ID=3047 /ORGANISM="Dunaliella tertiolecta, Strain CCMP1320" /LENGTH=40 /DNA_ID= /DNA_START= /DNA_END= /DNA_ORIENTATION=